MSYSKYVTFVALLIISASCCADWTPEVDKKYQQRSAAEYAKVEKANTLITNASGNTAQTHEAIELLTAVTKKDPNFAPAYVQLGRAALNLGLLPNNRYDADALLTQERFTQKALDIEPNYDYAIALMGFSKMFQGKLDEAEKYYKKAVEMGSSYPFLKSQLAQLSSRRGDNNMALKYALEGYEQNKSTPNLAAGAIGEIISAYQKLPGDTSAEEEKWYAKRCELVPSAWNWQAYASFLLYRLGDYEKSIEYGKKALSIMNFGVGQYTLAAAYYTKWNDLKDKPTRLDEANDAFKNASAIHPDTRDIIQDFMRNQILRPTGEALAKIPRPISQ